MNAKELAGLVGEWSDALTVAEVVNSRFLRVGARWDLHDWETEEVPGGLVFRRVDEGGNVTEQVRLEEPPVAGAPPRVVVERKKTSPVPRTAARTIRATQFAWCGDVKSREWGSNPRSPAPKAGGLPLAYPVNAVDRRGIAPRSPPCDGGVFLLD